MLERVVHDMPVWGVQSLKCINFVQYSQKKMSYAKKLSLC